MKTLMMTTKPFSSTKSKLQPVYPVTAKNSHSSVYVDRSQCEESAGSETEGSESNELAVAKCQPYPISQPCQNIVSTAYSGRDGSLRYKSVPQVGRANTTNVLQQAPGLRLQSRQ